MKKSVFTQMMILLLVALIGFTLTILLALFAGSIDETMFDWKNLNLSNMIPVLIAGGILTCISVIITVMIVSRSVFSQVHNFLFEDKGEKDK